MIKFPGEESVVQEIEEQLGKQLDFAKRCLQLWLNNRETPQRNKIPKLVYRVIIGLNTRICRLYRTAIELYQRGEAEGAAIIVRAMFESILTINYVLKLRFVVNENKKGQGLPTDYQTTREFRTKLYLVHMILSRERFFDQIATIRGISKFGKKLKNKNTLKECENIIGKSWLVWLKKYPHTYSGFSISDLSKKLGAAKYYKIIYPIQSEHVHSVDLDHYIIDDDNQLKVIWHSKIDVIAVELNLASALFINHLKIIHKYLNFGTSVNTALTGLEDERLEIEKQICKSGAS